MTTLVIILGFVILNVLLAYVPIILIVGYNLRPKKPKNTLLHEYVVTDRLTTEEYIEAMDKEYAGKKHIPLVPDSTLRKILD